MDELEQRVMELEIRLAWQDELLAKLNDTVAQLHNSLDLQQAQLRLLYARQQAQAAESPKTYSLADEVPPHY